MPYGLTNLQIGFGAISTDIAFLSSVAIIAGAVFVIFQPRQNNRLATMDLVVKIYDMANSLEVQRSWTTVVNAKISSFSEFEKLPEEKQLAFHQIASLFESVGLLVEKGYAELDLVDDMFAIQTAWNSLQPFVFGMRKKNPSEEYFLWFEKLSKQLKTR